MGKKVTGTLLKLCVLLIALQDVGASAVTPALGAIAAAFPHISTTIIQNISTMPALFVLVFSLIYGSLVKVAPKRLILYVAVLMFLVGGIAPAFLDNIWLILVFRAVVGASVGLLVPMANDLIIDFWEGEERKKMIGYAFAAGMLGGIVFQILGGILSDIDWHYTFFAYALSVVFFAIPLLLLPEPPKKSDVVKGTAQEGAKLPMRAYVLSFLNLLWSICFVAVIANGAIVIIDEKIGTGAEIGILFSLMTVAAFIGGALYSQMAKILKGGLSMLFCYWFMGIGILIFYMGHSFGTMLIAMVIVGVGVGYTGANFFSKGTDIVPFVQSSMLIALVTAFNSFGQFVSPFLMNPLAEAMGLAQGRGPLLIAAIALGCLGLFAFAFDRATPKIPESEKPQTVSVLGCAASRVIAE